MMKTHAGHRPPEVGIMMSKTVVAVVRILIASYFLAMGTGLVFDPASRTFLDAVIPHEHAQFITTTYLYVTAFSIMVGVFVRPAALLLSIYVFWSGFMHYDLASVQGLSDFWRDMALLGAVLMIAVTESGAGAQVRVWRRRVAPRRIANAGHVLRKGRDTTPRPKHNKASKAIFAGHTNDSGEIDFYEFPSEKVNEAANLFADAWEESDDNHDVPALSHG